MQCVLSVQFRVARAHPSRCRRCRGKGAAAGSSWRPSAAPVCLPLSAERGDERFVRVLHRRESEIPPCSQKREVRVKAGSGSSEPPANQYRSTKTEFLEDACISSAPSSSASLPAL